MQTEIDREHFLRIMDAVPCGIYDYYLDAQGVSYFPYCNQQFLDILGITREELSQDGSIVWNLFHPDDRKMVAQADVAANRSGQLFFVETRIITKKGDVKWLQISSLPTRKTINGAAVWSGYYLDITNTKRLQAELLLAQEQLSEAAVAAARYHERSALVRDVHDGFGSQLSQALMLLQRSEFTQKQMQQLLQECVADLYLVVDTFSDETSSLLNAFIDYRYRVQQRLQGQAVQVHWHFDLEALAELPQRQILHLLRSVQELLSNSLRHAKAQQIWIEASFDPALHELLICCHDDGVGMPSNLQHGKGLQNIHKRMREIGASIHISDKCPGTRTQIHWPVRLEK